MERETTQEALPGLELHEIVESMTYIERMQYKKQLLSEMSDREHLVHLINEANLRDTGVLE